MKFLLYFGQYHLFYFFYTIQFSIIMMHSFGATSEFNVYRMTQYDLNGIPYGSRSSSVSLEGKSVFSWKTSRHCVITDMNDLTITLFDDIRMKAGGLVIILPYNESYPTYTQKSLMSLEQYMITQSINIPVYFAFKSVELDLILSDLRLNAGCNKSNSSSILYNFFSSVSANSYHVSVSGINHLPNKHSKIPILQGELLTKNPLVRNLDNSGENVDGCPTIIITTHLKTFGIFNAHKWNSDIAVFMSIIDIFSKLYSSQFYAPNYRIMFLATESGSLLDFHATKKWLDEHFNIQNIDFVLCLDSIVNSPKESSGLFMHVSKPPKERSTVNNFFKILKRVAMYHNRTNIEGIHKKINLNEQKLQWEHERFNIKRYAAFTLSSLKSSKDASRNTIFTENDHNLILNTQKTTNIIIEALAHYIYKNKIDGNILSKYMSASENLVKGYSDIRSALHNNDLKYAFEKYLQNVKIIYDEPDIREPEFMFYEGQEGKLNIYRVKPAVFDLLLTLLISCYIGFIYFAIQLFPALYGFISSFATSVNDQHSPNFVERMKKRVD